MSLLRSSIPRLRLGAMTLLLSCKGGLEKREALVRTDLFTVVMMNDVRDAGMNEVGKLCS
jgi:hypothetical protein